MKKGYVKNKNSSVAKAYAGEIAVSKPRMSIESQDLPEVKNWKIDQEYTVTAKIKMTGIHKRYEDEGVCADFEVQEVKVAKPEK